MKNILIGIFLSAVVFTTVGFADSHSSKSPEGAHIYIIEPLDGATVKSPVRIKFGLHNMGVAPAGVKQKHTGHHHLLVDLETLPDLSKPLPANKNVRHFGGGQTEADLELAPGKHTLQLLLGNYMHVAHEKPVLSKKITITVKD